MIPQPLLPFASHLWQSTLFAAAVLVTLALRSNRAQTRYWVWLAASVKFLVPFSLLVSAGNLFRWRGGVSTVAPPVFAAAEQISQPFTLTFASPLVMHSPTSPWLPTLLAAIWLGGALVLLMRWAVKWRRIQIAKRQASPFALDAPIPVLSTPLVYEPGVFGIFSPVLLVPEGIAGRLTREQLDAILAHELCHVRRRDNLAAALHMLIEAAFWFHPLVWWIGARLVEERENACDEEVLRLGNRPHVYAEGILNVCKFYLESPLPCAAGVTGADLKKRIEAIMNRRISSQLTTARKLLLAGVGLTALAGPILVGIATAPRVRAQASRESLKFEVASIKPSSPDARATQIRIVPGGGMNIVNATLKGVITFAYNVREFQLSGGPSWVNSERFDIVAKVGPNDAPPDPRQMTDTQRTQLQEDLRTRFRALLAERFQLVVRPETKELPVYGLVIGKNGSKLVVSQEPESGQRNLRMQRGQLNAIGTTVEMLAASLSNIVGRTVIDKTGLKGNFDYKLEWTPDTGPASPGGPGDRPEPAANPSGPSIFTAIQEQLGLKLESTKGPVVTYVIEKVEKPSEN
jgi:bla regulator protein blaR1